MSETRTKSHNEKNEVENFERQHIETLDTNRIHELYLLHQIHSIDESETHDAFFVRLIESLDRISFGKNDADTALLLAAEASSESHRVAINKCRKIVLLLESELARAWKNMDEQGELDPISGAKSRFSILRDNYKEEFTTIEKELQVDLNVLFSRVNDIQEFTGFLGLLLQIARQPAFIVKHLSDKKMLAQEYLGDVEQSLIRLLNYQKNIELVLGRNGEGLTLAQKKMLLASIALSYKSTIPLEHMHDLLIDLENDEAAVTERYSEYHPNIHIVDPKHLLQYITSPAANEDLDHVEKRSKKKRRRKSEVVSAYFNWSKMLLTANFLVFGSQAVAGALSLKDALAQPEVRLELAMDPDLLAMASSAVLFAVENETSHHIIDAYVAVNPGLTDYWPVYDPSLLLTEDEIRTVEAIPDNERQKSTYSILLDALRLYTEQTGKNPTWKTIPGYVNSEQIKEQVGNDEQLMGLISDPLTAIQNKEVNRHSYWQSIFLPGTQVYGVMEASALTLYGWEGVINPNLPSGISALVNRAEYAENQEFKITLARAYFADIATFVESRYEEIGGPVSSSEVLAYVLEKNNGSIDRSLWDVMLFFKYMARNHSFNAEPQWGGAAGTNNPDHRIGWWITKYILDEFSLGSSFNELAEHAPAALWDCDASQLSCVKSKDAGNIDGLPYHVFNILALLTTIPPEVVQQATMGLELTSFKEHGFDKVSSELGLLSELPTISRLLNQFQTPDLGGTNDWQADTDKRPTVEFLNQAGTFNLLSVLDFDQTNALMNKEVVAIHPGAYARIFAVNLGEGSRIYYGLIVSAADQRSAEARLTDFTKLGLISSELLVPSSRETDAFFEEKFNDSLYHSSKLEVDDILALLTEYKSDPGEKLESQAVYTFDEFREWYAEQGLGYISIDSFIPVERNSEQNSFLDASARLLPLRNGKVAAVFGLNNNGGLELPTNIELPPKYFVVTFPSLKSASNFWDVISFIDFENVRPESPPFLSLYETLQLFDNGTVPTMVYRLDTFEVNADADHLNEQLRKLAVSQIDDKQFEILMSGGEVAVTVSTADSKIALKFNGETQGNLTAYWQPSYLAQKGWLIKRGNTLYVQLGEEFAGTEAIKQTLNEKAAFVFQKETLDSFSQYDVQLFEYDHGLSISDQLRLKGFEVILNKSNSVFVLARDKSGTFWYITGIAATGDGGREYDANQINQQLALESRGSLSSIEIGDLRSQEFGYLGALPLTNQLSQLAGDLDRNHALLNSFLLSNAYGLQEYGSTVGHGDIADLGNWYAESTWDRGEVYIDGRFQPIDTDNLVILVQRNHTNITNLLIKRESRLYELQIIPKGDYYYFALHFASEPPIKVEQIESMVRINNLGYLSFTDDWQENQAIDPVTVTSIIPTDGLYQDELLQEKMKLAVTEKTPLVVTYKKMYSMYPTKLTYSYLYIDPSDNGSTADVYLVIPAFNDWAQEDAEERVATAVKQAQNADLVFSLYQYTNMLGEDAHLIGTENEFASDMLRGAELIQSEEEIGRIAAQLESESFALFASPSFNDGKQAAFVKLFDGAGNWRFALVSRSDFVTYLDKIGMTQQFSGMLNTWVLTGTSPISETEVGNKGLSATGLEYLELRAIVQRLFGVNVDDYAVDDYGKELLVAELGPDGNKTGLVYSVFITVTDEHRGNLIYSINVSNVSDLVRGIGSVLDPTSSDLSYEKPTLVTSTSVADEATVYAALNLPDYH